MLDNLTLDQMRTFAAVVQAGSFRAGAAQLHRVQSAVSTAIANLEAQLGVLLFDRSAYKPALTPAGRSLLAEVRVILGQVGALKARARELQQGVELGLSVVVDTLFPLHRVAEALRRVQATYPGVGVRLECASMGGTLRALKARRCDVALSAWDRLDDEITRRFLMPLNSVAVAAPGHPLAATDQQAADPELAFADHVQIVLEDASASTPGRDLNVLSPRTWRVGDMVAKLALLRAGAGWGSLPSWLVAHDLAAGTLVRLPATQLGPQGEVSYRAYFCHRSDTPPGPAARLLHDSLVALAAASPTSAR